MVYPYSKLNFEKILTKFMTEEDPVLTMFKWLVKKPMDAEVASKINADKFERTEKRSGYRSIYRVRRFYTRMGNMYLGVPKLRKGGYMPFFISAKKRSETALMSVIQEAYINGVSTRKIGKLGSNLCIDPISRSQVSQIKKELKTHLKAFMEKPLQETYPVLWVDALYEKNQL